jgi:hypothetical protein
MQNITRLQVPSPTLLHVLPQSTTPEFANPGSYAVVDNSRRSKRLSGWKKGMEDREDGRFCAAGVENCRVQMFASTLTNFCKNMACPEKARGVVLHDLCECSVM